MDLQLEDHDVIDSDVDSDDLEIVYYKANTGFSPSCGLCRFDFRIDDTVVVFKENRNHADITSLGCVYTQ
ncbi:hypothetical protein FOCG_14401 [Fusarium oxysporum f. sp. radicis-lycopersici 26381]|uniref:Uncharacterized protein n=1 Tax=Fusarium oxysporum TaxID=5507 RepID=A0A8H5EED4_FUSOX|nr:hypothetical protein FOCG_14401 [Fusarium oxysporum f. sp. radicis-lycopersici 26381]KAF5256417.1 hypothetical protein FOXYS1_13108 [Fusarium oxysporum]